MEKRAEGKIGGSKLDAQSARSLERMRSYKESRRKLAEEIEEIRRKSKKLRQDQRLLVAEYLADKLEEEQLQQKYEQKKQNEQRLEKEIDVLSSAAYQEELNHRLEVTKEKRQMIQERLVEIAEDISLEKLRVERFKKIEQVIEKEKRHEATPREVIDRLQEELEHRAAERKLQEQALEQLDKERADIERELLSKEDVDSTKKKNEAKKQLKNIIHAQNRFREKLEEGEKELEPLTTLMEKLMLRGTDARQEPLSYEEILVFKRLQEEKMQRLMQEQTELMQQDAQLQEVQRQCEQQRQLLAGSRGHGGEFGLALEKGENLRREEKELYLRGKDAVEKYRSTNSVREVADIVKERLMEFQQEEQAVHQRAREMDKQDGPAFMRILEEIKDISRTGFLEKDKLVHRISSLKDTADFFLKETHGDNKKLSKAEREFRMEFAGQVSQFCEATISELKDPAYDKKLEYQNQVNEIKAPEKELSAPIRELGSKGNLSL